MPTTNLMGGETDWFVVPFTLAVGISRSLLELQATGKPGFDPDGFRQMVEWLCDLEAINDAMCY